MAGSGLEGRREDPLYFVGGVELKLNADAVSSELTYLGHFMAWVDVLAGCGVQVFLQHGSDDTVSVWCFLVRSVGVRR